MTTPASYLISGAIFDEKERPIPQARVYFTNSPVALPDIAALTGSDGAFRLSVPATGLYTIACAAEDYWPAAATVQVTGEQEVQVRLRLASNVTPRP
jgi:hypothetical protein